MPRHQAKPGPASTGAWWARGACLMARAPAHAALCATLPHAHSHAPSAAVPRRPCAAPWTTRARWCRACRPTRPLCWPRCPKVGWLQRARVRLACHAPCKWQGELAATSVLGPLCTTPAPHGAADAAPLSRHAADWMQLVQGLPKTWAQDLRAQHIYSQGGAGAAGSRPGAGSRGPQDEEEAGAGGGASQEQRWVGTGGGRAARCKLFCGSSCVHAGHGWRCTCERAIPWAAAHPHHCRTLRLIPLCPAPQGGCCQPPAQGPCCHAAPQLA